jgi:predicted Zn-dependent protease
VGGTLVLGGLGVFVPATRPFGQISEQALGLLFLKYGRDDELQADGLGVRYAASGGWDPEGVPGMLATLGRLDEAAGDRKGVPNWLSTHPDPLQRVQDIQPAVQKLKSGRTNFITGREAPLLGEVVSRAAHIRHNNAHHVEIHSLWLRAWGGVVHHRQAGWLHRAGAALRERRPRIASPLRTA